jgi:hypothetical protein
MTVRNHWDALTSWWYRMQGQSPEAVQRGATVNWMREWLRQHHNYCTLDKPGFKNRLWWFLEIPERYKVFRYEQLQDNLDDFLTDHGFEPVELELVGNDSGRDGLSYREALSAEVAEYIHDTFREEIEELGYSY